MSKSELQIIHNTLAKNGYQRIVFDTRLSATRYKAEITHSTKTFEIELYVNDDFGSFLKAPKVKIVKFPDGIPKRMPHVEVGQYLCYLDKESVFLDPFQIEESTSLLLGQISKVLKDMVEGNETSVAKEHAYEFTAYWEGTGGLYLASLEEIGTAYSYARKRLDQEEPFFEMVYLGHKNGESAPEETARKAWFDSINLHEGEDEDEDEDKINSFPACLIDSERDPLIAPGESWPPHNFEEFYDWFQKIDPAKARKLIHLLRRTFTSKHCFVNIRFPGEHIIGFKLTKTMYGIAQIDSQIRRKAKDKTLIASFKSKRFLEPLTRFSVENASQDFIQSRNNELSLRDKKIIVIGCGTIGGYLAHALVQNGAGAGQGSLVLYDPDSYSTSNIGRHILGGRYLRQIKSFAMRDFLLGEFFSYDLNIEAKTTFNAPDVSKMNGYDLIIDATGDSQFSTLLSREWHRAGLVSTPLLHGWIDAAGGAARALLDDGKKACFHCLAEDRVRVFAKGAKMKPIRRNCAGSSYFEFSSQSSMTTAGLLLDKAINYLNGKKQPRFHHMALSEDVRYAKNSDLKPTKGCPCCQI